MLDLYAFATPNSIKPIIALEELGLDYTLLCGTWSSRPKL